MAKVNDKHPEMLRRKLREGYSLQEIISNEVKKKAHAKNILLKLGGDGLLIHAEKGLPNDWLTDRIDALNSYPIDTAGAGDSLLITSGMSLAVGANIWEAACLGSLAAAVQVGRVGNTPLHREELMRELI